MTQPFEAVSIKNPCKMDFDKMNGDERVRFCSDCKLNVYNLSGMSRCEAEELIAKREGRLCVTFVQRADGTIITKDCQTIVGRVKDSFKIAASFIAAVLSGASLLTACSSPAPTRTTGEYCERDPLTVTKDSAAAKNAAPKDAAAGKDAAVGKDAAAGKDTAAPTDSSAGAKDSITK